MTDIERLVELAKAAVDGGFNAHQRLGNFAEENPDTILALCAEVERMRAVVDAARAFMDAEHPHFPHLSECAVSVAHENGEYVGEFMVDRHWVYDTAVPCDCLLGALADALSPSPTPAKEEHLPSWVGDHWCCDDHARTRSPSVGPSNRPSDGGGR